MAWMRRSAWMAVWSWGSAVAVCQGPATPKVAPNKCALLTIEQTMGRDRRMPDVTGCVYDDVQVEFVRSGSKTGSVGAPSTERAGIIFDEDPKPNTPFTRGTQVTLYVSTGEPPAQRTKVPGPQPPSQYDSPYGGTKSPTKIAVGRPAANLTVTAKFNGGAPLRAGGAVSFLVTVQNHGPDAADASVTGLPTNLQNIAVSGACSSLSCGFASLAPNTTVQMTVKAVVTSSGRFGESVRVSSSVQDPDPSDNAASAFGEAEAITQQHDGTDASKRDPHVNSLRTPFLTLRGETNFANVSRVGEPVSATITLSNTGNGPARNVLIVALTEHLSMQGISGSCVMTSCVLEPGQTRTFNDTGKVFADGRFELHVEARSAGAGAGTEADAIFSGRTSERGPGWVLWLPGVVGLLLLGSMAVWITPKIRRRWWTTRIAVRAGVNLDDSVASCGRLHFTAPAIGLSCEVATGMQTKVGAISYVRAEVIE